MVQYRPPEGVTSRARKLRRNSTDAERRLWRLLRRCFPDAHFRRQVPIRDYIADFASHRARLVIEADGGQHVAESETYRTQLIEAEGYRLLRFWNHDILANGDSIATAIACALDEGSPPP